MLKIQGRELNLQIVKLRILCPKIYENPVNSDKFLRY